MTYNVQILIAFFVGLLVHRAFIAGARRFVLWHERALSPFKLEPSILPHERAQLAAILIGSWTVQKPEGVDAFLIEKALFDADRIVDALKRSSEENVEAGAADYVPPPATGEYPSGVYVPNLGDVNTYEEARAKSPEPEPEEQPA